MPLILEPYAERQARLPHEGRHITAQFNDDAVVVYQAYRPAIGLFAASHGYFGGPFLLSRMSWVKPNFLWMMYRSGWGRKPGQEVVLAVWIQRAAFDLMLSLAVHSKFVAPVYQIEAEWKRQMKASSVRLQWDPDRSPPGGKLERRAIQLGLRREILEKYAAEWIVRIEDVSGFVADQVGFVDDRRDEALMLPREEVYPVRDEAVARRLGLAAYP